jgi:hypothetical protein
MQSARIKLYDRGCSAIFACEPCDDLWYEFDAASLDTRAAVIALDASTFIPFDPRTLDEYRAIPDATKTYYRAHAHDERLFVFEGIPHVLYRGTLDVRAAVLLEV